MNNVYKLNIEEEEKEAVTWLYDEIKELEKKVDELMEELMNKAFMSEEK